MFLLPPNGTAVQPPAHGPFASAECRRPCEMLTRGGSIPLPKGSVRGRHRLPATGGLIGVGQQLRGRMRSRSPVGTAPASIDCKGVQEPPRRFERNRFAKKKATALTRSVAAMEGTGPRMARTGPSTDQPAREATSIATKVGTTGSIGRTQPAPEQSAPVRVRSSASRFDFATGSCGASVEPVRIG